MVTFTGASCTALTSPVCPVTFMPGPPSGSQPVGPVTRAVIVELMKSDWGSA